MTVDRRFVLKGMVLGGAAGLVLSRAVPVLGSVPPSHSGIRPALALVGSGAAEAAFLQGARAAGGTQLRVWQVEQGLDFMLDFERQLREGPMRLIGLLDDASAGLVLDLARSAGARVQWLGQHTVEGGSTRHRVLNTDLAEGCSRQLSRQLHACGAGFTLDEERQGSAAPARQLAGPARHGARSLQWAAGVGYLLAALGSRPAGVPPILAQTSPASGSFVSFSIEA